MKQEIDSLQQEVKKLSSEIKLKQAQFKRPLSNQPKFIGFKKVGSNYELTNGRSKIIITSTQILLYSKDIRITGRLL